MTQQMLINAVHAEQKRMATVEDGKLIEFNIKMAVRQPITGNIYKGVVLKVERGLQAAFVNYGGKKDGFLPLRDVSHEYFTEQAGKNGTPGTSRHVLKAGQEILVQVLREVSGQKGALLTSYLSIPGRYLVLLPNKQSSGVSRKIEDESDRTRLKEIVEQIKTEEGIGFIVRTAGLNRTKQELSRDYQHLLRLWQDIQEKAKTLKAPALIYQESDFGVITLRDYFTPEITEILVDDPETFKIMRAYCKAVAPRHISMIKLYKEKTPIFDKYNLEDQIRTIYQDRVNLKSGGYVVIKPTEAMITIDVNSGKASNKRNIEETAFKTNIEAAEEIARQLRLRDLGGLIAIDFIDMMDRKNVAEVERTFKKALSIDRARIQLARISKFGILELSRQKKHSTIQEISYMPCPHCRGMGNRPSLEYIALSAFRKIESQAVKDDYSHLKISLPYEVSNYLLNQKRTEIAKLESLYDIDIHLEAVKGMGWDEISIETTPKKTAQEPVVEQQETQEKPVKKKRSRRKKKAPLPVALPEAEDGALVASPEDLEEAVEPELRTAAAATAETAIQAALRATKEPTEDNVIAAAEAEAAGGLAPESAEPTIIIAEKEAPAVEAREMELAALSEREPEEEATKKPRRRRRSRHKKVLPSPEAMQEQVLEMVSPETEFLFPLEAAPAPDKEGTEEAPEAPVEPTKAKRRSPTRRRKKKVLPEASLSVLDDHVKEPPPAEESA